MGTAPATTANRRHRFTTLRSAEDYVESAGFSVRSKMDQDIFSIWKVTLTRPVPRTKRRSWNDLSPSYQKRLMGSKIMQEQAAQYGLTVPQWYERAPDLRSARGHLPAGGFPTPQTLKGDVWYEVYLARTYELTKGVKRRDGKQAATSRRVRHAWKTTNTRRSRAGGAPIRIGESLAAVLGMAGEAAGDAGEALEETGELWDDDW